MNVDRVLEITFVLIVVFLVARNASNFSTIINAVGKNYVSAVKALQGL